MAILQFFNDPIGFVIFLLAIGLAIGIHEAAHAWTADKLGDSTARLMGRTSINPLVHLDLVGTLLFLVAGFGWGKPVPVDERNLRSKYAIILVALAGPVSNLLIAAILGLIYRFIPYSPVHFVLALFIMLNLSLMIFNLIPIPPLDGSKILRLFLSDQAYFMLEQYGFILILALFFLLRFGSVGLSDWLLRAVQFLFGLFTGAPLSL